MDRVYVVRLGLGVQGSRHLNQGSHPIALADHVLLQATRDWGVRVGTLGIAAAPATADGSRRTRE